MPLYGAYIWSLTWAPQLSQNVVVNEGCLYDTPLMLWWAIKITLHIIIPETLWFCSLPYNHRIFSLSNHNMTDKNLWLLTWMFLRLQLTCFKTKSFIWQHIKITVLISSTFLLQFGSYPLYTVWLPVQHAAACSCATPSSWQTSEQESTFHYQSSLTVHYIFKFIFYSIFQPFPSHMPQPLV